MAKKKAQKKVESPITLEEVRRRERVALAAKAKALGHYPKKGEVVPKKKVEINDDNPPTE